MTDREFWDRYFSSLEDLAEEPPPSVKENVFHEMDRRQRWRRSLRKGAFGLIGLLFLSGGTYYLSGLNDRSEGNSFSDEGIAIWDRSFPGLNEEEDLFAQNVREKTEETDRTAEASLPGQEGKSQKATGSEEGGSETSRKVPSSDPEGLVKKDEESASSRENRIRSQGQKEEKDGVKGAEKEVAEKSSENSKDEESVGEVTEVESASSGETIEKMPKKVPEGEEDFALEMVEEEASKEMFEASLYKERFFLGTDVLFNSTRILDEPTLRSFDESSLVATDPDLFLDFALTGGVNISDRSRFLVRYFMKKDFGQRYYQYREGRYSSQSLQLSYRSLDLLFEHDLTVGRPEPGFRTALSVYGGGHYGHLRQAIMAEDGQERSIGDELKSNEYGVDLGMRFGFRSAQGLDVGLQLGGSYGLNDITKEGTAPSLSSERARNFSLGVGLSCRYHLATGH